MERPDNSARHWRTVVYKIIFEADTPKGKLFDVLLILSILLSVMVVFLDSVGTIQEQYGTLLSTMEWLFTILFTIEYMLRIVSIGHPAKYMVSFFGVVDFLAILPSYLSLALPGSHYLIVIRILRVLRVFRVLKLAQYLGEARMLSMALRASGRKILIFLFTVLTIVVIIGSIMYIVEGRENGFTSIPRSVYWAIVTLTTVGYGDISPNTPFGQFLAAVVMILGYGIIAVPTGIVTVEMAGTFERGVSNEVCPHCASEGHDKDAVYCKYCGHELNVGK